MTAYNVFVHPQALIVVSNHYTRLKYDHPNPPLPVNCGILLGNVNGSRIEICSALEVVITKGEDGLAFNSQFFTLAYGQLHKETFPQDFPIGWYSCAKLDEQTRIEVDQLITPAINEYSSENLIYGEFYLRESQTATPLDLFINEDNALTKIDFAYEAEHAERVAMNTIEQGDSVDQIKFTVNAFKSLDYDLERLVKYLENVKNGNLPFDREAMRKASNLAQWWDHNTLIKDSNQYLEEQADLALFSGKLLELLKVRNHKHEIF